MPRSGVLNLDITFQFENILKFGVQFFEKSASTGYS